MGFVGKRFNHIDSTKVIGTGRHMNTTRGPTDGQAGKDFAYVTTNGSVNGSYLPANGNSHAFAGQWPVANIAAVPGAWTGIIPVSGTSPGTQETLSVFKRSGDVGGAKGLNFGFWKNTTGSSKTVHARNTFSFGGYAMGVWVIVSATAPDALTATLANDAAAAGATNLNITSGQQDGTPTIVVPDGQWLYIVQIDANIAWQGGSDQFIDLRDAAGTLLAQVAFWPSQGGGNFTVESWKSPVFITSGALNPPTPAKWRYNQTFLIPAGHYAYVVYLDYDITWAGLSDQHIVLGEWTPGPVFADRAALAFFPTQVSGHFAETWTSPFFITAGGSPVAPSARWGSVGSPKGVFPAAGGATGYYQNSTGADMVCGIRNDFGLGGYGPFTAVIYTTPLDPNAIAA